MAEGIRLSKVIAARGVASRREAETLIEEGRVTVNSELVSGVVFVTPDDEIKVDGRPLPPEPPRVYYLLYKPRGYITGRNDPEGRKSVLEFVKDLRFRVEPVGRLDFDTEGALLLTNDGDLAHQLTHPSRKVPKRYLAKVYRTPSDKTLAAISSGDHEWFRPSCSSMILAPQRAPPASRAPTTFEDAFHRAASRSGVHRPRVLMFTSAPASTSTGTSRSACSDRNTAVARGVMPSRSRTSIFAPALINSTATCGLSL